MKLKFLGSGTSQGVPVIGCHCAVCRSGDPRDSRTRSSALITTDKNKKILIDCGPDFRMQMLSNGEDHIDAVLLTHEHNDHVIGLDDLRPLIFKNDKEMPLYCAERVGKEVRKRFSYAFAAEKYPGAPSFQLREIEGDFRLLDAEVTPVSVMHHWLPILGFKFKNLAYITDASLIPAEEIPKLQNLDYLILNCIRKENEHPAHFILPQILEIYRELKPKKMYLTHLSHHMGKHEITEAELPAGVHLAYDGLELEF